MKNNTIVKIILIIFFISFFSFLFWFFYEPEVKQENNQKEEDDSFLNIFFPSNYNSSQKDKTEDGEEDDSVNIGIKETQKEDIKKLRQISKIPTAAAYIESISKLEIFDINKKRKKNERLNTDYIFSEIRYVAIKNNHLYHTYDFTNKENRISNITIPKILQVDFFDKNNFLIKYKNEFDVLKTYLVNISDKTEVEVEIEKESNKKDSYDLNLKKFQGIFFPDKISDIYINKKKDLVFYTTFYNTEDEIDGKIHGILTTKSSENKKEIFRSPLREWNFSFNNADNILASTKNSGIADSLSFSLDTKNGSFKKISKAEKGLNGLPNYDFSKILYSQKNDLGKYILVIKDIKIKEEKKIEISTFIDKCVWSKNNIDFYCAVPKNILRKNQPDDWYKGKNYFRDDILKIDSKTGLIQIVFNTIMEGKYFDIIDLKLDDREKYLYWKNKRTDFVWSYDMFY